MKKNVAIIVLALTTVVSLLLAHIERERAIAQMEIGVQCLIEAQEQRRMAEEQRQTAEHQIQLAEEQVRIANAQLMRLVLENGQMKAGK
jgi:hypothetical protein